MSSLLNSCSRQYNTALSLMLFHYVDRRRVLEYQHQRELEQKKSDEIKVLKIDKINWAGTMEATVLHLKLVRTVQSVPLVGRVR